VGDLNCDQSELQKGEKLMVVPSTAKGFRSAVNTMRSFDGKDCMKFHNFSFPEDHCMRLLMENLGRFVVREELVTLKIRVQGVMKLPSGSRKKDHTKDCPPTLNK